MPESRVILRFVTSSHHRDIPHGCARAPYGAALLQLHGRSRQQQNAACNTIKRRAITNTQRGTQAYIKQLESNPLRTKMLTAGTLNGLQELLASFLAKDRNKHGHYFTSRVPKMAAYGALIAAPVGHVLIYFLQKIFAGRTSLKAKIMQIIVSNLVVRTNLRAIV